MIILRLVLEVVLAGVFGAELFLYGLRHYEIVSSGERSGPRRGAINAIAAFVAQWAAVIVSQLSFPFAFFWPFRPRESGRTPVLLVHGHAGHRGALVPLAWALRRRGFGHVVGVNLPTGDVWRKAKGLARAANRIAQESGSERVDVVAHSLGGLVARAWVREYGGAARLRRLVTLGSPHQGTRAAAFGLDRTARSLLPGSRMLDDLARDDPVPTVVAVTSIFSTFDNRILPHRNAFYPGAANVEVAGIGHDAMLFSPKIHRLVVEALEEPGADAARRAAGG